jgi:hypothetical protein
MKWTARTTQQAKANPEVNLAPLMSRQAPQAQRLIGSRRKRETNQISRRDHGQEQGGGGEIDDQIQKGSLHGLPPSTTESSDLIS